MLSLVTIAAVPDHRCFIENVDTETLIAPWNSTDIISAIPLINGELDSCNMFVPGSNETTACTKYVYDDTYYKDTRSMEWNMVCDNRYRGAVAQTIYMLGVFTGAVVLGKSDIHFIRKTTIFKFQLSQFYFQQVDLLIKLVVRRFSAGQGHSN